MTVNEDVDLYKLTFSCAQVARHTEKLLTTIISEHAHCLLDEGFLVTDPNVLIQFAEPFKAISLMKGTGSALTSKETPEERFQLIVSFAIAINQLQEAIDLTWSSDWTAFIQGKANNTVIAANDVYRELRQTDTRDIKRKMDNDIRSNADDEAYRR